MLINRYHIKRKPTRHLHMLYNSYIPTTNAIEYNLSNDDFLDIISNNDINNIQEILFEKLKNASTTNIYNLMDYITSCKIDLENNIKINKNNNKIFYSLSSLFLLFFMLIYIYILLYLDTKKIMAKIGAIIILIILNIQLINLLNNIYPTTSIQNRKIDKLNIITIFLQKIIHTNC